ncbi:hypothetical protein M3989_002290 [Escherichia coli]|uniref:hypothetical protein n=1 Tax=Escherichia coli TaxID=562 RepID=UPI0004612B15|nr:hypothetical protein [Escherichia coli]APL17474.1 hypothetical protein RG59_04820 [Escherichia coli]EFI4421332.1 hypothetical protein [Escherichia coli]EFN5088148.1 hypothetical protein [Escherichia coli]EHD2962457.1 hypothetical protein [Escherichia coli]EHT4177699.1 hypothetical protein [Escherichia coli]
MIIDEHFKDRVSSHLSQKIIEDALNGRGFFARNVLESIRLLEGMKVAPSTLAMRHQERELKGALAGFHHIHVSEDNFTRAFNAYRQKGEAPEKNPSEPALQGRGNRNAIQMFLEQNGVSAKDASFEELIIRFQDLIEQMGEENAKEQISRIATELSWKPFKGNDVISGDWLVYWVRQDGVRFYIDSFEHIPATDTKLQNSTANSLHAILQSMDTAV